MHEASRLAHLTSSLEEDEYTNPGRNQKHNGSDNGPKDPC